MTQKFKETEIGKIPEDWEVSEVGNLVNHKKGFAFKSEWYKDEGVRIIKVSNLTNDSISFKNCTYIDEELAKEYEEYELRPDDIIIATVGSWPNNPDSIVGKVIRVPKSITKELLNQNAVRLRVKDAEASSQSFLYYRLKYKDFSDYIVSGAQGSANQASITLKDIFNFEFGLPSFEEQKRIVNILEAFDDKIDLNRKMNQTLEAMAQAIFNSWFVDFEPVKAKIAAIEASEDAEGVTRAAMSAISGMTNEELEQLQAEQPEYYIQLKTTAELFPASMQDSDLGEIPEGWGVKALSNVIDVNPTRILPKGKLATKVSMADLNTWQSWIDSWQKDEYTSGPKFKNGDTIFARITPSLENGKTAFVNFLSTGETAYGSTEFIIFGPKIIASGSYIFCLSRSEHIRETAINAMTGTSGRQRVPNDCFDHLLICVPPDKIVGKFNEIAVSLFKMIEHNSKESIHLKEARDTLLPKLLSGELSVGTSEFM